MHRVSSLRLLTKTICAAGAAGGVFLALAFAASSRTASPLQGQKNPPPQQSAKSDEDREQDAQTYDPGRASEDIEVGTFYMHKGDVDAAIGRFEDAVRAQPNLGKARLLLAGAYEKKGDRDAARKCYQDYLKMFPKAPDAEKIQKKIEKLSAKAK